MTKISKVRNVELLACDAGWRNYHFVKITPKTASSAERIRQRLVLPASAP